MKKIRSARPFRIKTVIGTKNKNGHLDVKGWGRGQENIRRMKERTPTDGKTRMRSAFVQAIDMIAGELRTDDLPP